MQQFKECITIGIRKSWLMTYIMKSVAWSLISKLFSTEVSLAFIILHVFLNLTRLLLMTEISDEYHNSDIPLSLRMKSYQLRFSDI